jgi:hypothetical protein
MDGDNAFIGLLLIRRSETAFRHLNGTEGNLAIRQSEKRAGMNKHVQAYFLKDLVPGWKQSETVPPTIRDSSTIIQDLKETLYQRTTTRFIRVRYPLGRVCEDLSPVWCNVLRLDENPPKVST